MEITIHVRDDLATRLRKIDDQLEEVLERGLRELNAAGQQGFKGAADVLETLARLPSPEEVLALRPSKVLEKRLRELLEKNRREGLTPAEEREWEQYQYLEHLVRMAKARAQGKLQDE